MKFKSLLDAPFVSKTLTSFICLENVFGEETATLMISEAHCESMFEQVNTVDGSHMEPFTSDSFEADKKIEAMRNANTIKKNIQKLVRIFRRPDKEALLRKEFKDAIKANPEQSSFAE